MEERCDCEAVGEEDRIQGFRDKTKADVGEEKGDKYH
ncbi:hypothetical protein A2U01_0074694 [Trifolium medium]|uniref:Uncharacterized protein n=1 Tax=Trifolium medium TaxID=97028 RepID=A0A392SYE6_9FABA|nr:hypothetical protein [Trifolium medium]